MRAPGRDPRGALLKLGPSRGRRSWEPPPAAGRRGWKYHHLGIPTAVSRPGKRYLEALNVHVSGFETSPFGIEWMRFDPDCPIPELVRTVPHLAFEVEDLEAALEGQEVLSPPGSPSQGVRAATIVDDGAPVELIEFRGSRKRSRAAVPGRGRKGRGRPVKRRVSRR